jgi:hypothetical protein
MKHFPEYHNKIWEWDFAPSGDRSRTRKGWRLFAYVSDSRSPEPIHAVAFVCFDKSEAPKNQEYAKFIAGILKAFLAETVEIKIEEDRFRRVVNSDGETVSLCYECCETVLISADPADVDLAESTHECAIRDIAASTE